MFGLSVILSDLPCKRCRAKICNSDLKLYDIGPKMFQKLKVYVRLTENPPAQLIWIIGPSFRKCFISESDLIRQHVTIPVRTVKTLEHRFD